MCPNIRCDSFTLPDSQALPSAKGTRRMPKCTRQRLCRVPHSAKNTQQKIDLQRCFCRVPENPTLVSVEAASRGIFRAKFAANAAGGIRTRDLSLARSLPYHCTTHSYTSIFSFTSLNIILNRV